MWVILYSFKYFKLFRVKCLTIVQLPQKFEDSATSTSIVVACFQHVRISDILEMLRGRVVQSF